MAFTGTATVAQVSDNLVRITGLSLAGSAAGTIGLTGATGTAPGVTLPASFQPAPYEYGGDVVALADSIQCTAQYADTAADPVALFIAKTGTTVADFRITVTNDTGSASSGIEFYVRFH